MSALGISSNVRSLNAGVSASVANALRAMDSQIVTAIDAARDAGVPQGLIVGLLHAHAHTQTGAMSQGESE